MKIQHVTIAAAILAGLAGHAADAQATKSVQVDYADLNIASPAGMATLERRIAGAADRVCDAHPTAELAERTAIRQCRKAAIDNAMNTFTAGHAPVYASR